MNLLKFYSHNISQIFIDFVIVVQLFNHVWISVTPWITAHKDSLFFTISWNLLTLMPIESVTPSIHFILCRPFPLLPSIFPSIFSNDSALHIRWPKYWSFSFSTSPSNEYSGLNIQTHVHWVDDAIQPPHPLSPSYYAFSHFQHQFFPVIQLFTSGGQSLGVLASASVLPMNTQGWFPLELTDLISWLSKGIFPTQELNPDLPHCRQMLYHLSHQGSPEKPQLWLYRHLSAKWCLCFLICCLGLS